MSELWNRALTSYYTKEHALQENNSEISCIHSIMATLFIQLSLMINSYQNIVNNEVWEDILQRFNKVNKVLQKVTIDLETVISMYNSLIQYINDL